MPDIKQILPGRLNEKPGTLEGIVVNREEDIVEIQLKETGESLTFPINKHKLDSIDLTAGNIVKMLFHYKKDDSLPDLEFENTGRTIYQEMAESFDPSKIREYEQSENYRFLKGES
ncbi:hypothetical protein KY342_03945 [Candidatus Woesearchaeota archaeon]|nr:hypothetical protein [Candidatus Woesearchaeota archaeon]